MSSVEPMQRQVGTVDPEKQIERELGIERLCCKGDMFQKADGTETNPQPIPAGLQRIRVRHMVLPSEAYDQVNRQDLTSVLEAIERWKATAYEMACCPHNEGDSVYFLKLYRI